jgi:hypothetical protein
MVIEEAGDNQEESINITGNSQKIKRRIQSETVSHKLDLKKKVDPKKSRKSKKDEYTEDDL